MKIYEISCEICQDLIPLVKDNIASDDTRNAVYNHIKSCENCRAYFGQEIPAEAAYDKKLLRDIRFIIVRRTTVICLCAVFISACLPATPANISLMLIALPALSAFGYILLERKWFIIPVCVFISRLAAQAVTRWRDIIPGNFFDISAGDIFSNLIVVTLCFAGVAVYHLIKFAFSKE